MTLPANSSARPTAIGVSTLDHITTPSLVLEVGRLERNLARVAAIVAARGVTLRPHLKTAKSLAVAQLAAPNFSDPITVSTLLEAEYFFANGYQNIFFAACLGPGKFSRAATLLRAGARLITSVDAESTALLLTDAAKKENVRFFTAIEIDCGEHRSGMLPESPELIRAAQALGENFVGVCTHGGQSYSGRSSADMLAIGQAEIDAVLVAAARLRSAGMTCEMVSIGSSPTALTSNQLAGVTEIRAGVYMFGDLFQAAIGTCSLDDLAVSVLTEIIGRPAGKNSFIVDAGAFALSKDISTAALPPEKQAGFGLICDLDGKIIPGLKIERVWQEHGLVVSAQVLPPNSFPIGTRLRVLPNHVCPTAAAHSSYNVVRGSRVIEANWPRINGW